MSQLNRREVLSKLAGVASLSILPFWSNKIYADQYSDIKNKLKEAADRNIIVYDADAKCGRFTKRLVSLMGIVSRRNAYSENENISRSKLHTIILSPKTNLEMPFPIGEIINSGVTIEYSDFDMTNYYLNDLKSHLQCRDKYIVLGIAKNQFGEENYLLGSC